MCVFAYMSICVCIAIVHIPTVLIFAICYIQSFMATLMVTPSPLLGSVSMKACTLHLSFAGLNFRGFRGSAAIRESFKD